MIFVAGCSCRRLVDANRMSKVKTLAVSDCQWILGYPLAPGLQRSFFVTSSDALVTSSEALVTSSDALVTSRDALVTSSEALVTSSDALVTSSDALFTSSDALVTSSFEITFSVNVSLRSTRPFPPSLGLLKHSKCSQDLKLTTRNT